MQDREALSYSGRASSFDHIALQKARNRAHSDVPEKLDVSGPVLASQPPVPLPTSVSVAPFSATVKLVYVMTRGKQPSIWRVGQT